MTQNQKRGGGLVRTRPTALASRTAETSDSPLFLTVLKSGLWGVATALGAGLILITVATAVAYANPNPSALIPALSLLSLLPSMFAGGFVTAKKVKDAPLLCGIISGGMITLITMLLGIVLRGLPSSGYAFWQSAALHTAAIAFSVLGAFAGNVKRRQKPGKRRFGR